MLIFAGAYRKEILDDIAEPKNAIWNLQQYQGDKFVNVVKQDLNNPNEFNILSDKIL